MKPCCNTGIPFYRIGCCLVPHFRCSRSIEQSPSAWRFRSKKVFARSGCTSTPLGCLGSTKAHVSLEPLFRPRGVAFVGATPDPQRYGGRALQYCIRECFGGGLYVVNPKYQRVFDLPCFPDVAAIPGPVDVVVILVGPTQIPRLLDDCRSKGVRFAIALGDIVNAREAASSARLQELREKIAKGAPRIVGPVCVGVLAPYANLALTISSGMLAGSPPKGGIGLISQSGGVMSAVLDRAHQFGTGFSALVSSGGEFDLNVCDYIEYMLDDSATRCIAIYAEKIDDASRLFALADRARKMQKPILMMKAGRSEAGARTALTHSGALASDREIEEAAFRRHGIVRVFDIDDLHMSAELLCRAANAPSGGVAVVSQSGGYCTVVADALNDADVPIAELSPRTVERVLVETPVPHVGNPHDSATGPPGNNAPHSRAALLAFQDDPNVGVTLYAETMYMYQDEGHKLQMDVARYGRKPHLVCWQGGRTTEPVVTALRRAGVLTFDTLRTTVAALAALYRFRHLIVENVEPDAEDAVRQVHMPLLPSGGGVLDDAMAKSLLRHFGVPLVPEVFATTSADAVCAA